jgi:hypothetical protein
VNGKGRGVIAEQQESDTGDSYEELHLKLVLVQ